MLYRAFGKTGWQVSAVGLGTWNLGDQWGEIGEETALRIIHRAIDRGMNLLDAAESYGLINGLSELRLGRALGAARHRLYLVSKIGNWGKRSGQGVPKTTPDMIRLCGHACLGRLHTDWIDLMLCHEGNIEDPSIYLQGFEQLEQEGHIRAYGISTTSAAVLQRFNEMSGGKCAAVELDYSLLNRAPEDDLLPYCQEHGIAVLIRGPVAMGLLSGKYTAESRFTDTVRSSWHEDEASQAALLAKLDRVDRLKQAVAPGEEMVTAALRYTFSHPTLPVTIPGATKPEQVEINAAAGERELTPAERQALLDALA